MERQFQLTRSVGSVTTDCIKINVSAEISTHTLRGERDVLIPSQRKRKGISTHTLRGERDFLKMSIIASISSYFNSHAPWGA